ncbi:hypothetical protein ES332_D10G261000v1 [Gossypium tomentosum]|uniref:Uncharacterized protein n=1 Tax=Gossypium tomentosum TaxID=34277 RepID=A0A5D2JA68_GOSTO|nr:hypothetical protein ES332_D10G261000v1 [Gossypium tomentosum]
MNQWPKGKDPYAFSQSRFGNGEPPSNRASRGVSGLLEEVGRG